MLSTRRLRVAAGLAVSALVAVVAVSAGTSATSQSAKIVIWADADRVPAVTPRSPPPAGRAKGVTVQVVQKQSGPIRQEVSTRRSRHGAGHHRRCARLSRRALGQRPSIIPLSPSAATRKQFPAYALNAFSYGTAIKKSLRRARGAGERRTRDEHEAGEGSRVVRRPREAARSRRRRRRSPRSALAVQQGQGRRVPHVPVLLRARRLRLRDEQGREPRPSDIGVANPEFLKNASLIDKWNKRRPDPLAGQRLDREGRCSSRARLAYWITGPWFMARHPEVAAFPIQDPRHFPSIMSPASSRCRSSASRATW